jgi:hypothetical protein
MIGVFEAELPLRLARASRVQLQQFIPAHWFAVAASECVRMYIAGSFYGAISVAQAYIEALTKYLAEFHQIRVGKDVEERCRRLQKAKIISGESLEAALAVFSDRNDYHHLNRDVEQEFQKLEQRAEECLNHLHSIESDVFAYSLAQGKIVVKNQKYWPPGEKGLTLVNLRQLW